MSWAFFANTDGVYSSIDGKVSLATTFAVVSLCLVGPVPPRVKSDIFIKFNP